MSKKRSLPETARMASHKDILDLQASILKYEADIAKEVGKIEVYVEKMQKKYNVEDVEEAEKVLDAFSKELEISIKKINELEARGQAIMDDVNAREDNRDTV
jgi:hypothetical protein